MRAAVRGWEAPIRELLEGPGGGAVLLVSSTGVTISGAILANASANLWCDGGSGGGVRIVAPAVLAVGSADVSGGTNSVEASVCHGGNGRVWIYSASPAGGMKVIGSGQGSSPVVSYGRT